MATLQIVVDRLSDWGAYYPTEQLITVDDYLHSEPDGLARAQVINLCESYRYMSEGYYCSLLAEARGHKAFPTIKTINDLNTRAACTLDPELLRFDAPADQSELRLRIFFGLCDPAHLTRLARSLFEQFPCPMLEVRLKRSNSRNGPGRPDSDAPEWRVTSIKTLPLTGLAESEQELFAQGLNDFSRKIWRKRRGRKKYSYEMAILVNRDERTPPSNARALKQFVRTGRKMGMDVDFISRRDYIRLAEYDALFIRETTSIANHTYRFAKRAEAEGMPVIDDPDSIIRCTNKVYLDRLLAAHNVDAPQSVTISRDRPEQIEQAIATLGLPLVLKIPDGSFSLGISRVETAEALRDACAEKFKRSNLLLAQEFLPTDYDWRIGLLNHQPLFACRYYMSCGHWQIYQHHADGRIGSGDSDCVPLDEVPRAVLRAAKRAARLIGDGLYGVDIKQQGSRVCVIEVNDNPNIDAGVEDLADGAEVYEKVMQELLRRIETRHSSRSRRV